MKYRQSLTFAIILLVFSAALYGFVLYTGASTDTFGYRLEIADMEDEVKQSTLALASQQIVSRRAAAMGIEIDNIELEVQPKGIALLLTGLSKEEAAPLTAALTAPFTFEVMEEATEETADITINDQVTGEEQWFKKALVNDSNVQWISPTHQADGKGRVAVELNEEGTANMKKVFQRNVGKSVGLFVRERLIAKLLVDSTNFEDDIVISDIPTPDLAFVFADDVNVGLYVTFVPLQ